MVHGDNEMVCSEERTKDILVIYEQEAEEWALYLKSLFGHIVNEEGILLYNLGTLSFKHLELFSLRCYKCKLLILSYGLLKCLNQESCCFLAHVLQPPDNVVILLCGVENSEMLYELLTLSGRSREIFADQEPEDYLSIVTGIIQTDCQATCGVNLSDAGGASEKADLGFETEVLTETLETNQDSVLVIPARISCENPGEIFILLKDEIDDETLEIEFIADNQRIRTQPASWNKKVKYMKALDLPAGPVYINVYCEGVIKTTAQIEYYTAAEEIERIFQKVADPIAFICQTSKFSSMEKLDNVLTLLLENKIVSCEFSAYQGEEQHHQQPHSHLEKFPTLLHCAARFGLKNLTAILLKHPEATRACKITNIDGDVPASIAEKHGHKKIRELIKELSIKTTDDFSSHEEEEEYEDAYMLMGGMEAEPAIIEQNPGDQHGIGSKCQQEAEVDKKEKGGVEHSAEETEEEDSYTFVNSPDNLYASIPDCDYEANSRECFLSKKPPPPPPRNLPGTLRQDEPHQLSQERNSVEERSETEHGLNTACYREDQDTSEEDDEEDHPYTFVEYDEYLYDLILDEEDEERRKERKSFIMNRPPVPAPRPEHSGVRNENTPYIVQVFQQKATQMPSDYDKTYCDARKHACRKHTDMAAVKHNIPAECGDLIRVQKQLKKGAVYVDESLDRCKQWQNEKQRLQPTPQDKVCHLRATSTGKRLEKENPNVSN
ncbi:B-cell scaffold protein with ankyrin repeats isoform X2 [Tympanuchus pallidicinctus]|uniref:B-cell scaffold protein with ankyrin repeats isoform X2 n=1 Tax=Tympanuchus pallidicinctus TaxID=109042 RepID=UPI0022870133|nr:B-cell scaffold protein with ankyrin repeats isoform X2 [Tympanuchus pallidicinctus]